MDSETLTILIFISVIVFIIAFAFIINRVFDYNKLNKKYQELLKEIECDKKISETENAKQNYLEYRQQAISIKNNNSQLIEHNNITTNEPSLSPHKLSDIKNPQDLTNLIEASIGENKLSQILKQENDNLQREISVLKYEKWQLLERIENADEAESRKWDKRRPEIAKTIARSIISSDDLNLLYNGIANGRLINSLDDNIIIKKLNIVATIPSTTQTGVTYQTSLTTCTCKDRQKNPYPCKHSLFLAYSLGVLQIYPTYIKDKYTHTLDEYNDRIKEKLKIEEKIKKAKNRHQNLIKSNNNLEKVQQNLNQIIERLISEKCSGYPYLAGIIADLETIHYKESAEYLENKKHPAKSEAKRIKELHKETQLLASKYNELKYKFEYIKNLYPNIEDIFDEGFNRELSFKLETDDNTDRVRSFLSHEEYISLSVTDRNQLALDRYIKSQKSKWQVGRDYEMYIGYTFEQNGYNVEYTGILKNIEDMGRDLIVRKGDNVLIIQCKNWAQEKIIHEKHIFQLYGSILLYQIEHPDLNVSGMFITTTQLSDNAMQIAMLLKIDVDQCQPMGDFPRIKCNINRQTGEKIYHLPFDQQYDKTVVKKEQGEFMVFTVKEAESAGFRRAFKHIK